MPASLSTYLACQAFNPDLIISAGTAGGFKARVGQTWPVLDTPCQFMDGVFAISSMHLQLITQPDHHVLCVCMLTEALYGELSMYVGMPYSGLCIPLLCRVLP